MENEVFNKKNLIIFLVVILGIVILVWLILPNLMTPNYQQEQDMGQGEEYFDGCPDGQYKGPDGKCYNGYEGDLCMEGSSQCKSDLYCGPDSRCHTGNQGNPCWLGQNNCKSSLYCGPDSKCHDGSEGDMCLPLVNKCKPGLKCIGMKCEPEHPTNVCPQGQYKAWNGKCYSGKENDMCNPFSKNECKSGLTCSRFPPFKCIPTANTTCPEGQFRFGDTCKNQKNENDNCFPIIPNECKPGLKCTGFPFKCKKENTENFSGNMDDNDSPYVDPMGANIQDGLNYIKDDIDGIEQLSLHSVPSNYYFLDDGAGGEMSLHNNLCSKSCCSDQWPTPFKQNTDPFVCKNKQDGNFVPSKMYCNNSFQDSGCLCLTRKQANYLANRGGNGREWF